MRTLTAGLLAAQRTSTLKSSSYSVLIDSVEYAGRIKGNDGAGTETIHIERPYGGRATLLIANSDKSITADLRGKKVVISYGYGVETKSPAPPLWVFSQKTTSLEGKLGIQLECIDIWLRLSLRKIFAGGGIQLKGTITGSFTNGDIVHGDTSGAIGTVVASNPTAGYILVGKVSGTFTAGETVHSILVPSVSMTATTVTSIGGGSSASWNGDKTIFEILDALVPSTFQLDSTDGVIDSASHKPYYSTVMNSSLLSVIQDMMKRTYCAARAEEDDKIHLINITSAPGTPDYTYSYPAGVNHNLKIDIRDVSEVLPNQVYIYYAEPGATGYATYAGYAEDAASRARGFGDVPITESAQVVSDAGANAVAAARIAAIQKEATRGTILVPMNCGQELFDYIKIIDNRANVTYYGWIGGLTRRFGSESAYSLTVELGNLTGAEGLPSLDAILPTNAMPAIVPPVSQANTSMPRLLPAYLPIIVNVVFTAVDNNDMSWAAGTLKCADGTSFTINSGTLNLANANPYYLYYNTTTDNHVLTSTQTFTDTIGAERLLVAFALSNSVATEKATIIPGTGGTLPTIAASAIFVGKLSAITADMGLLTAGEIRVGTGTLGVNFTGWRMWVESSIGRFAGYLSDVQQFYTGSDGKLYAGGGIVKLDIDGLHLTGSGAIRFEGGGAAPGLVYADTTDLYIKAPDITDGTVWLIADDITGFDYVSTHLLPKITATYYLGSADYKWAYVYRTNESACELPTSNSALKIIKKMKAPEITDGEYGERHYFKDSDMPDEVKCKDPRHPDKEPEIEFTRLMGVLTQAIRELVVEVDSINKKIGG
jgi:hypothetical protein